MKTKEAVCKKIILSIFSLLVLCRTAGAQDAKKRILSAADAGTCTADSTACSFLAVPSGSGGVTFTITTNASANTVQFEATGDTEPTGSHTWVALSVFPSNSTASVTSTTSTGTWQANIAGFTQVRLRMSTFIGGTTTTYINLSTASARVGGGGGLPSGVTSPGLGSLTGTGTFTADIGSFNSVGANFVDMACSAESVGNSNQTRYFPDGTCWPSVSMNTNAAQKLALSMGVVSYTTSQTLDQSHCGKLVTFNGVSLTVTLAATVVNSACEWDVIDLAATSLTIGRNGRNVNGAAANPTALTTGQAYHIVNDGTDYWTTSWFPGSAGTVTTTGSPASGQGAFFSGAASVTSSANWLYSASTGHSVTQGANNTDAFFINRFTDTAPTGNFLHFQNAAKTNDIFNVSVAGIIAWPTSSSTSELQPPSANPVTINSNQFGGTGLRLRGGFIEQDDTGFAAKFITNTSGLLTTYGALTTAGVGVTPILGVIHSTGNTAAISTATLCGAGATACGVAGQYHIHWAFIETGTACATPGTGGVTFLLTWTDTATTAHSAVSLGMDDASAINAVSQTFHFQTTLAAAWASGDFNISTNGAIIQYATGYTACGVGTGSYQLDIATTRLQ